MSDFERPPLPRPLVHAAWSMVVEQQHHNAEGWSMAKSWAWDHLREAVEPFLVRDATGDVVGFHEPTAPASTRLCCDDGPDRHTEQQHHDASACFDNACPFEHPHGGPFPHPCDREHPVTDDRVTLHCGAQDWATDHCDQPFIYGTCGLQRGHNSSWHQQLTSSGKVWAEWRGSHAERAPKGVRDGYLGGGPHD